MALTNQVASSALRGQEIKITLNAAETASDLPNVTEGQKCTIGSSSKVGYVTSVDTYGNSFKAKPITPATLLDSSSTPGVFAAADTVTLA